MNITSEKLIHELDFGKQKMSRKVDNVDREIRFTQIYDSTAQLHPYLREAECLKAQTAEILMPITEGNWFAGELNRMFVGIDPERGDLTEVAYFCQFDLLKEQFKNPHLSENVKKDIRYLLNYWSKEQTYPKCRAKFPDYIQRDLPNDCYHEAIQISHPMYGLGGASLDYKKLVSLGLNGLRELIEKRKQRALINNDANIAFLEAMLSAIDTVIQMALKYANQALNMVKITTNTENKYKLELIAQSLKHIAHYKPQTYHQAIQLVWLYNLVSLTKNYGRMDDYLGDFLANDLKTGTLNYSMAFEMTTGLWKQIYNRGDIYNNRIVIGGKGRTHEQNANEFALLALEVQAKTGMNIPQLSLRWYKGMPEIIWNRALEVVGKGSTFPIFYNDDINIEAFAKCLNIPLVDAEQYVPYGCGEFVVNGKSIMSPDSAIIIPKCLDATLRNGIDGFSNQKVGLALGALPDFETFEQLQAAFARQIDYQMGMNATIQECITQVTAQYASYPMLSILYDDCIEKGKPLLAGGVRYLGGCVESFGNNSAADALLAIKIAIYDKKLFSAQKLLEMLDNNFEGYDAELKTLQSLPKFGNDNSDADAMAMWVNQVICESALRQKNYTNLHHFAVVLVNNGDNVTLAKATGATADGRRATMPVSNGNQPSAGCDTKGITALLNSMAKLNPALHAGATHNIKFSRQLFKNHSTKVSALLKGYFTNCGTQAMITVTDANELKEALIAPQNYSNLIVRVGGYSERFIDLPREVQMDVLQRTLYE